jgi:integrase
MHRLDVKWDVKLRRALGCAGIVVGFEHRCRRKGCGFKGRRATAEASRCPRCQFRLYAKPIPRHVRFHDLRHYADCPFMPRGFVGVAARLG